MSTETIRLIRDGEKGGGGRLYTYRYTVTTRIIPALRWAATDERHSNVPVGSNGQSHRTVSTNHNFFEERGEPKRYRTEVLPLTNLTPYRQAKLAHLKTLQRQDHYISHDRPRGYSAYFKGHIPHLLTANPYHQ